MLVLTGWIFFRACGLGVQMGHFLRYGGWNQPVGDVNAIKYSVAVSMVLSHCRFDSCILALPTDIPKVLFPGTSSPNRV